LTEAPGWMMPAGEDGLRQVTTALPEGAMPQSIRQQRGRFLR